MKKVKMALATTIAATPQRATPEGMDELVAATVKLGGGVIKGAEVGAA